MLPVPSPARHLYAVVPAEEASRLPARRSFSVLASGAVAALFGPPPPGRPGASGAPGSPAVRAALRHDRIVGLALATCSSVVPFRLGLTLGSTAELEALLGLNSRLLAAQLSRFRGRVEMGLKVRLQPSPADPSSLLPQGLDRVRGLAPEPADRCERLGFSRAGGVSGKIFAASYLVSRHAVDDFWRAVEALRAGAPELPLLGSGPWAAYSFCDVPLRRAAAPPENARESEA